MASNLPSQMCGNAVLRERMRFGTLLFSRTDRPGAGGSKGPSPPSVRSASPEPNCSAVLGSQLGRLSPRGPGVSARGLLCRAQLVAAQRPASARLLRAGSRSRSRWPGSWGTLLTPGAHAVWQKHSPSHLLRGRVRPSRGAVRYNLLAWHRLNRVSRAETV